MMREEMQEMMARMMEVQAEMAARAMVPNVVDMEAVNMVVQADIAVEAMERMVAVMEE